MHNADKSAGIKRALCDLWSSLTLAKGRKVQRQARRKDMPELPGGRLRRMQFGPKNRGERIAAKRTRVRNRVVVILHKVL